jgi:polygalacturonase
MTMKGYIVFLLSMFYGLCASAKDHDVRSYGAAGNGVTLDSPAIQKAIDACTASGGGKVIVPAGTYLSGTIILKDNVTLHLEQGATLLGAIGLENYDWIDEFTEGLGIRVGRTFICAMDAKNVAIQGRGVIDGQGAAVKAKQIETDTRPEGQRWGERPFLLRVIRCEGVRVQDVTLKYSASWTSHYQQSKDIEIRDVIILSRGVAHNDGIGIDGCQKVRISGCNIDSGDDALVFKTTHSRYPCRDIVVDNMRLKSNQAGIKMGTESMAPFEDIRISDCHIYDTNNGGIKLMTVDGASLQNVEISDITMDGVRTPILLRLGSRLSVFRREQDEKQTTGLMRNVIIRNVKAKSAEKTQLTSASGILITGVPGHDIRELRLENIEITLPGGGTSEEGRHSVPEAVDQYPEVKTFGPTIPSYGIWMRHVDGVEMNDITFIVEKPDLRPVFICEDAENVRISALKATGWEGSQSAVRIEHSRGIYIGVQDLTGESDALVELRGADVSDVNMLGKYTIKVRQRVAVTDNADLRAASFF